MGSQRFEYTVDRNDVITAVNQEWRVFARENDGGDLEGTVLGTWLWQHLAGMEVKHLYRVLVEKVRVTRRPVRVPFRCDAPELRRDMVLELEPLAEDAIRFSSWVVEERERPRVRLLEAGRPEDSGHTLFMCAWCKRIRTDEGTWVELEDALGEGDVFDQGPLPKITHAVCQDCQTLVLSQLQEAG